MCIARKGTTIYFNNVNTHRPIENPKFGPYGQLQPQALFANRLEHLMVPIAQRVPDIISLCELSEDSLGLMGPKLEELGYTYTKAAYCNDPNAFWFLVGSKTGIIKRTQVYTFTTHPTEYTVRTRPVREMGPEEANEFYAQHLGTKEEFEKSIFYVWFNIDGSDIVVASTHFGLRPDYKMACASIIAGFTDDFIKTCGLDETTPFTLLGDFNSFKDQEGEKQMRIIAETGKLDKLSDHAKYLTPNGFEMEATSSFSFFLCDVLPPSVDPKFGLTQEEIKQLVEQSKEGGTLEPFAKRLKGRNPLGDSKLDHMLSKNLKAALIGYIVQPTRPDLFTNMNEYDKYVETMNGLNLPPCASDHFGIFAHVF